MTVLPDFLEASKEAVFVKSSEPENGARVSGDGGVKLGSEIRGIDFNTENWSYSELFTRYYRQTGFQASHLGEAIDILNEVLRVRQSTGCKIFLGYTSNMISCGIREVLRFLVEHKLVDCIVTTAGGIEEDFIKCLKAPTFAGSFEYVGKELRGLGLNRIGNLLVPNDNYCKFEDWLIPILDEILEEQKSHIVDPAEEDPSKTTLWTPSRLIDRLGKEINDPESVYYWAHKNGIPVFCPAITDGSLGDMIYFHSYKNPGLILDLVQDIRALNSMAARSSTPTAMIICGGGVVKHHICNANLMRNGADYAVYINTAHEFDGSDSGARPDEAVSWGKIRPNARSVKVCADATLVFPILVAETFVKHQSSSK